MIPPPNEVLLLLFADLEPVQKALDHSDQAVSEQGLIVRQNQSLISH